MIVTGPTASLAVAGAKNTGVPTAVASTVMFGVTNVNVGAVVSWTVMWNDAFV